MQVFSNNADTKLAQAVAPSDTTIIVNDASKFPASNCKITLETSNGSATEIVTLVSKSDNIITVTRAQEGTLAGSFEVGDLVELRLTAGFLNDVSTVLDELTVTTAAQEVKINSIMSPVVAAIVFGG